MNSKHIGKWVIVLFLLAALSGMTAVVAQGEGPGAQAPAELTGPIPWQNTEFEPNNTSATATDWCDSCESSGGSFSGVNGGIISSANDVDYWEVYVPWLYDDRCGMEAHHDHYPMLIDIEAQSLGSPLDTIICLYSDDGVELACNNDTGTPDSMLYYNFETSLDTLVSRRYYLAVRADSGAGAGPDGKYQLLISTPYLFSAAAANLGTGYVDGIPFQAGDIMAFSRYWSGAYYRKWVQLVDLSDLAVKGNVTNLSSGWRNSDYLLVSFAANATLPGISGTVTPWEVVVFDPTKVGANTQGTFQRWWNGKQQGLTTTAEKPDAIDWPDWSGSTQLYASSAGTAAVYGGPGTTLKLPDEDIGLWRDGDELFGPVWGRFFDSSRVAGLGVEDVIAFSYAHLDYGDCSDASEEHRYWYMVFQGAARCGDAQTAVTQKDVALVYYGVNDAWDGTDWMCDVWHGPDHGWNYNIDAIQMQRTVGGLQ